MPRDTTACRLLNNNHEAVVPPAASPVATDLDLPSTTPVRPWASSQPQLLDHRPSSKLVQRSKEWLYSPGEVPTVGDDLELGGASSSTAAARGSPPGIESIPFSTTEADYSCWRGTIVLAVYVFVWVAGALSFPISLVLLLLQQWIPAAGVIASLIVCWTIPIKPSSRFRQLCLRNFTRYFSECSLAFEHVPSPTEDRPTILAVTPHGVFSLAWALCYICDEFTYVYFCFSSLLRHNPYLRVLTESLGHPSAVSKQAILRHMRQGRSIAIIPGAWHEATIHTPSADRIWIMRRKGFVKYALQNGYTITPTYCFGEKLTYSNPQGCYNLRLWLNDRKIMAILPFGRWWCPLLPKPCKLHVVVGAPIDLPCIDTPTHQDVDQWHAAYVRAVELIFERHKVRCYGPEAAAMSLEVW